MSTPISTSRAIFITLLAVLSLSCVAFASYVLYVRYSPMDASPAADTAKGGSDDSSMQVSANDSAAFENIANTDVPARVILVDMGRIVAAWSNSPAAMKDGEAEGNAATLRKRVRTALKGLSDRGILVLEPRYALTFPTESDRTMQFAKFVGVDLALLDTEAATPYARVSESAVTDLGGGSTGQSSKAPALPTTTTATTPPVKPRTDAPKERTDVD